MSFIAKLFHEKNYNYGVLAVVRSAFSAILSKQNGKTFGQDEIVSQTMRGFFKLPPSLPKLHSYLQSRCDTQIHESTPQK